MAAMEKLVANIDNAYVEFDRKLFIEEIVNLEFCGNIPECARRMKMNPSFLHDLIFKTSNKAGKINLTRIMRYCLETGKDPLRYITKIIR